MLIFQLRSLLPFGLENKVVALLRYLPYLKADVEITPMSNSYSYFRAERDAREVLGRAVRTLRHGLCI